MSATDVCPRGCDNSYVSNGRTYSRVCGCELRGVYDGVAFWFCPECRAEWQRFEPGSRVYAAVAANWAKRGMIDNGEYAVMPK